LAKRRKNFKKAEFIGQAQEDEKVFSAAIKGEVQLVYVTEF